MTSITINEQNTTASSTDVRELWDLAEKKHLAGGRPTPLKNMKVSWDYCSHILWKIKFMFQTTNQMAIFNSYVTNYRPKTRPQVVLEKFWGSNRCNTARRLRKNHRGNWWISNFTNGYKLVEIPPVPVISWFINPSNYGDIYRYLL